ncbi:MAG TPA: 3'(2'),5'-bisphosphate nucleotidase CysQ [Longimicrobium sp.]|nr:3'(2'),5'-bisphosphate nucleotidase CysQ [Longimicrobium sp.]
MQPDPIVPPLRVELAAACDAARAAGRAAMRFYGSARAVEKEGGSPVTEADHAANRVIVAALAAAFPGDAVLSEESADSAARLAAERVWIVDPLDGTREFLAQNGEFAVMIGLAIGGRAVLGAVYQPADDVLFAAAVGEGASVTRHGETVPLRCGAPGAGGLRLVGSRSHPDPLLARMQEALGITDVRPSGSVGVKCGLIARGERDLYVHPVPYLKEWDTCAPEAILRAAGGEVTDCRGEPLRYNKPDPRQPHGIVACGPGVLRGVLARIGPVYQAAAA